MKIPFRALSLFTLSLSFSIASQAQNEVKHWKDSKLSLSNYQKDIVGKCNEDEASFLGCVNGLNILAMYANAASKNGLIYATAEEKKSLIAIGDLVETGSDGLNLYELNADDSSKHTGTQEQKLAAQKQDLITHAKSIGKLFKSSGKNFNFSEKVVVLSAKIKPKTFEDNESYLVAWMYDMYLQSKFDPHSRVSTFAEDDEDMADQEKTIFGVGIVMSQTEDKLYVNKVVDSGPAMIAGIKKGDQILSIDGVPVTAKALAAHIYDAIAGEENTQVSLQIGHKGTTQTYTLTRAKIVTDSVESRVVTHLGVPYGYIRLESFEDEKGALKVYNAIETLEARNVKGLILDLRANPGGLVDIAVKIGGIFVGKRLITLKKDLYNKAEDEELVSAVPQVTDLPLAILINGHSASASELLSGALQDYGRSWIVGERSFGKGSVQGRFDFSSNAILDPATQKYEAQHHIYASSSYETPHTIAVWQTIARFYQPSGRTNQVVGILPDFEVKASPKGDVASIDEDEDDGYDRESDRYVNPLTALGTPWTEPKKNLAAIKTINECRDQGKEADQAFVKLDPVLPNGGDYQLFAAEEVLKCAEAKNVQEKSVVKK